MDTAVTIMCALCGAGGLWSLIQHVIDLKHNDKKEKNKDRETLLDISKDVKEFKTEVKDEFNKVEQELKNNNILTIALGREKINYLCHQYMDLGYIPRQDYVAFKMIGDAYIIDNKQNTEVKTKFEWCIDNLEVK